MNTRWSKLLGEDVSGVTSEECIVKAGLDWKVSQASLKADIDGLSFEVPNQFVNYREDTKGILGLVTSRYRVLQNKEAFTFLDSTVGSMDAMYVNAGSFGNGKRVYIQVKLPGYLQFGNGDDRAEKYLTFITSHDGSTPVVVNFTPTRIVCQNTFLLALQSADHKSSIRHTASMYQGLFDAQKLLDIVSATASLLESISNKLIDTPFKKDHFPKLLESIGIIGKEKEDGRSTRSENILDEVLRLFEFGAGADLPSAKGTAWGAYNSIVEYVDHYRGTDDVKRTESAILGSGAIFKDKALELLTL